MKQQHPSLIERSHTLTYSDLTSDLFLYVGSDYGHKRLANWYTRLMRDEVLCEWKDPDHPKLHLHCHVSGGFVFGTAKMRL